MKTVVPLSGGLDSATVLAGCVASGDDCLAVWFDYDQPHRIELESAKQIAAFYKVQLDRFGFPHMPKVDDVVFAGRNFVFAAMSVSIAQAQGYDRVAFGCNASDWARFPDCRPEFWREVGRCAKTYGVTIITPLIYMSKRDVVESARKLNVPIELTWSCYSPMVSVVRGHIGEPAPCGDCLACKTRNEALA